MSKYITILASRTIYVTKDLNCVDYTDRNAAKENKLNVKPVWTGSRIKLAKGTFDYPAEIAEWFSVKQLAKDGTISIGGIKDDSEKLSENAKQDEEKLAEAKAAQAREVKKNKKQKATLEEIAE